MNVTPEFERDLKHLMARKRIRQKSEAIRLAVREAARRGTSSSYDYRAWLGLALKGPLNPRPKFRNEDQLWS